MYILIASFELMLESLLIYGRYENRNNFKTTCVAITAATCACATNKVGSHSTTLYPESDVMNAVKQ